MNVRKCLFILFLLGANAPEAIARTIVTERGGSRTKVVQYDDGTWQLLVASTPYFIKGVLYTPVKIGEDPNRATMRDWMLYDDDKDGRNDPAFQSWVDENKNNKREEDEQEKGDFALLKEMGCNTIRVYHVPSDNPVLGNTYRTNDSMKLQYDHAPNKELLRTLYREHGIRVIIGNFAGSWTIGAGVPWDEGVDYTNAQHRENIKRSVTATVLDHKDEPYVLLWLLGNENNIADWSNCNAKEEPEAYAQLIGELARMIHDLDPTRPVAVCEGDSFNTLRYYANHAPEVDIVAYNAYRGKHGFGDLWKRSKELFDRPIFLSEFGIFAYAHNKENPAMQEEYIRGCWKDIVLNSAERFTVRYKNMRPGNSLGGVVFDWLDRWYMDGEPFRHNGGRKTWNSPDGTGHEEWFGILSMGKGKDALMRQKRAAYDYLQETWTKPAGASR